MDSLLLSRITKDFLNLDPEVVPAKERYRMGWGGSVLVSPQKEKAKRLVALREHFASLFSQVETAPIPLSTSPTLPEPKEPPEATFRPPWYFSKGALEKKVPDPILFLLTETNEAAQARPVPGTTYLFRSLCKGKGTLKRNEHGLVYLDVENRFISMMLPYLRAQNLVRPPYFNLLDAPHGAHVPVIPAREASFQYLDEIEQLGREFSFEVEGLYSMEPVSWPEVEQVWFFKLISPELENLRRRYFLPGQPGGHAFHIAVAIKPRVSKVAAPRPQPLMRISPAFSAA